MLGLQPREYLVKQNVGFGGELGSFRTELIQASGE
jgi:hypothetical protein